MWKVYKRHSRIIESESNDIPIGLIVQGKKRISENYESFLIRFKKTSMK